MAALRSQYYCTIVREVHQKRRCPYDAHIPSVETDNLKDVFIVVQQNIALAPESTDGCLTCVVEAEKKLFKLLLTGLSDQ